MEPKGAKVEYDGVSKIYGSVHALCPTNLRVEPGEFFSIIGPSGSGKTTLLGVTAGFIPPNTGKIFINKENIVSVPPYRRSIGMVFQDYALFPHMNVEENVGFPLKMRGFKHNEIASRVDRMLSTVHLDNFHHRRPSQLSGGQQQRVALARAAVYDPLLLLMDEPLSALDKNLREAMQDEVKQFHITLGSTVLYVTHDQVEASAMSDRIAIMNGGRIEQIGTPKDLYEHPRNRFVASFLGEANLFNVVSVEPLGDGSKLMIQHGLTIISSMTSDDRSICACIRPESINISLKPKEQDNCLPAKVIDTIYASGSLRYRLRIGKDLFMTARMVANRGAESIRPGTEVYAHWQASDTLMVDDIGGTCQSKQDTSQ
jgi:putative spermidine/putrescine transport system ATP-binding protein